MRSVLSIICFVSLMPAHAQSSADKKVVRIPLQVPTVSLSPIDVQDAPSLWVARQINCQLVRQQGRFLKNEVAKNVHFLGPKKIEMELDPSFKFHDGSSVKAEDVVATFRYLNSTRATFRNIFGWIKSVDATKENTVVFNLSRPAPNFLKVLSAPNYGIFKKSFIEAAANQKNLWEKPMGCGDYRIQDYQKDKIVLAPANEQAKLQVEFDLGVSLNASQTELEKYDFVIAPFIESISKSKLFREEVYFDPKLIQLGINTNLKRWKKREDRCNLLASIDASGLPALYTDEKAEPAPGIIPRGTVGFSDGEHFFDYEKTNAPKTEQPVCMSFLSVSVPTNFYDGFKNIFKAPYKVTTVETLVSAAGFGSKFTASDCDVLVVGLKSHDLDGYEFLQIFSQDSINYTGFHDAKIIRDLTESQSMTDTGVKAAKYREIEEYISKQCLVKPLVSIQMRKVLVKKELQVPGIGDSPINEYFLGPVH